MGKDITDAELRRIEAADLERAAEVEQRRSERAAAKRLSRIFNDDNRPADLAASGVPLEFHPTKERYEKFWRFIIPSMGADPDGWWYGTCLLHGKSASASDQPSALYNFGKGVMRCIGEPCCHAGKGSMSMSNAYNAWFAASLGGEDKSDAEAR
jgi:hypothetical protein